MLKLQFKRRITIQIVKSITMKCLFSWHQIDKNLKCNTHLNTVNLTTIAIQLHYVYRNNWDFWLFCYDFI